MSPAGRSRGTAASCLSRRHRKEKRTRRPARSIAYALDAGRGRAPLEGLLHELRRCLICPYLRISFAYVDRRETGMPGGDTTPPSGVRRAQPGIVLPRLCPRCGVILPPGSQGRCVRSIFRCMRLTDEACSRRRRSASAPASPPTIRRLASWPTIVLSFLADQCPTSATWSGHVRVPGRPRARAQTGRRAVRPARAPRASRSGAVSRPL
jgi:hypothetical protein